jgi:ABC-type Fe3+/spermidine/putrescine transport system ATPase subunit
MSSRVAVLNGGRMVQCDEPERLYKRPRTRFVADFFRDCNVLRVSPLRGANKTPIYRLAGTLIGAAAADGVATGGAHIAIRSETFTSVRIPRSDRFAFPVFLSKAPTGGQSSNTSSNSATGSG